ncbi:MAG: hypothetical protein ACJ71T_10670 [Actinomycetales bacterium]
MKSSSTGNFTVNLDPSTLSAKYLDRKGRPDIELRINNAGKELSWRFTADRSSTGWTTTKNETDASVDGSTPVAETLVANFGANPTVTEVNGVTARAFSFGKMSTTDAESAGARADRQTSVGTMVVPTAAVCAVKAGNWYYNRVEPFTHAYPGSQAPVTVVQKYGVDHTLGVAVSIQGGPWGGGNAGGSRTISLYASGSQQQTHNSTAFNSLNFREYLEQCGSGAYKQWRQAENVYAILSRIDPAAEPSFTSCTTYTSGDWTKYRGVNITYHNDVNVIVADVNAQSGYSPETELSWHILHKSQICGSNSFGWATAPEAEANSFAFP